MSLAEIKEMSPIERIQAMEHLWDSMMLDENEPPPPHWHGSIIKERKKLMDSGKSTSIPLSRLKGCLRK